jgi:predicted transcriptional regulator
VIYDIDIIYNDAMRALVDIGEADIAALNLLAHQREQSRAALIRDAISDYLAKHRLTKQADAFGLWGSRTKDGLAYQEAIRSEW